MKPIVVSTQVDRPCEEVFAFLDVLANHELFTDHMLVDWTYEGPETGVGAKARMRAKAPGPKTWTEIEVVAAKSIASRSATSSASRPSGRLQVAVRGGVPDSRGRPASVQSCLPS